MTFEIERPGIPVDHAKRQPPRLRDAELRIALVNNMPDAALAAAERQFTGLIESSRGDLTVRIDLFELQSVRRSVEARKAMAGRYGALRDLMAAPPHALIVTGAEPRAADLADEPYWDELTALVAWARSGAVAGALYSCLAAHAAVRIADGVKRRPLGGKLSGVYATEVVGTHELTGGRAAALTPHSRYNGLEERDLIDNGYLILTRSTRTGVDVFAKEGATLEAFWQGHPEYEADTLAREIRRDLQRFASGEIRARPALPENYFAPEAHARLSAFLANIGQTAGVSAPESLSLDSLVPKTAPWGQSSRRLMGAFLTAVARRAGLFDTPSLARARPIEC